MKIKRYFFLLCGLVLLAPAAFAAPEIAISVDEDSEVILLQVPDISTNKVFTLDRPGRLVVDVPAFELSPEEQEAIVIPNYYRGSLVKGVRYGRFDAETSRFVFDLGVPVKYVVSEGRGETLRITLEPLKKVAKAKRPPAKPIIIIDPGHGGQDPGTIGSDGTREKDIVLAYAKQLKTRLLDSGKYDVVLTRDDDTFIRLRDRIAIARKANGSLFISLHADSAPSNVRGLTIYTVSEKASDEEAEALAGRENKADILAGMDLSEEREDVAGILISLAQRETNNRSSTLADLLVVALSQRVKLVERSHRFAGFAVLKAPDIPSVLIELGFLSDPTDRKLLQTKSYRDNVIKGIMSGIDTYFRKQQKPSGQ